MKRHDPELVASHLREIDAVMGGELFDTLVRHVWAEVSQNQEAIEATTIAGAVTADSDDPLADFPLLSWLWENREEILAFVLKIFGLFVAKKGGK
jgi:hypothetical protein